MDRADVRASATFAKTVDRGAQGRRDRRSRAGVGRRADRRGLRGGAQRSAILCGPSLGMDGYLREPNLEHRGIANGTFSTGSGLAEQRYALTDATKVKEVSIDQEMCHSL